MQVARSVGLGSRRGAKGGVRVDDPQQLFCIRTAMEMFAEEPPSLLLLFHFDTAGDREARACLRGEAVVSRGRCVWWWLGRTR
jgi:hypothetical protein